MGHQSPGAVEPILDIQVPDGTTPNNVPAHLLACVIALAAATGISRLSVSERDALRPVQKPVGRMIFNVTGGLYEWWTGADWWPVVGDLRALLPLAGGTMTGPLILHGDPVADNGAASKHYVDTRIPTGDYLPLSGGTMRGAITLAGAPVADMHAASKAYVDAMGRGLTPGAVASFSGHGVPVSWAINQFGSAPLPVDTLVPGDVPVVADGTTRIRFTAAGTFLVVCHLSALSQGSDTLRRMWLDVQRPAVETVARTETFRPGTLNNGDGGQTGLLLVAPVTVTAGHMLEFTGSIGSGYAFDGTVRISTGWIVRLPQVGGA